MADLLINTVTVLGEASRRLVHVRLTDADGIPLIGYVGEDVVVDHVEGHTGSDGRLVLDVIPNEDVNPEGTCYTVEIGRWSWRILKSADEQTLLEALVEDPVELGPVQGAQGPAGPAGSQGPQGPAGPPGDGEGSALPTGGDEGDLLASDGADGGQWVPAGTFATSAALTSEAVARTSADSALATAVGGKEATGVAAGLVSTHAVDTTSVHGIADTSVLATDADVSGAIAGHVGATDPHGDRAYTDAALAGFEAEVTPHAASHEDGGDDELALAQAQVTGLVAALAARASNAAPPLDQQVFTSGAGNWTKPTAPAGCVAYSRYRLKMWGGGGGGASGRKGNGAGNRYGGGAGAGGCYFEAEGALSGLAGTVAYSVGAAGSGGAAQATNSSNGVAGGDGGTTTFGVFAASGGPGGAAGSASNGISGNHAASVISGVRGHTSGNAAMSNPATVAPTITNAGLAGGVGGSASNAGVPFNGGPGQPSGAGGTPAGGVVDGAVPTNGTALPANVIGPGPSGSGGASSVTTTAQSGLAGGGIAAGGGGGGGATDSLGSSGAGGAGGAGAISIVCY